jgi:hypothetical protein
MIMFVLFVIFDQCQRHSRQYSRLQYWWSPDQYELLPNEICIGLDC